MTAVTTVSASAMHKKAHAALGVVVRQARGYAGYHNEQRRKKRLCGGEEIEQLCAYLKAEKFGHTVKRMVKHHAEHCEPAQLVEQIYSFLSGCHGAPPCIR